MTHKIKAGDKVKVVVNKLSFGAFKFDNFREFGAGYREPTEGDTLNVVRVRNNVLYVTFEHCRNRYGGLFEQGIRMSDVEPLKIEPQQPTADMTKKVLKLLQDKGSLTGVEAGGVIKCRMLPYQIHALRNLGWKIKTELKNDTIDGQRYARYHLLDSVAA